MSRTLNVGIVGPRPIISIDIDNITLDFPRVQDVKGIAQRVSRCTMSSTCVTHENLNGTHIIQRRRLGNYWWAHGDTTGNRQISYLSCERGRLQNGEHQGTQSVDKPEWFWGSRHSRRRYRIRKDSLTKLLPVQRRSIGSCFDALLMMSLVDHFETKKVVPSKIKPTNITS